MLMIPSAEFHELRGNWGQQHRVRSPGEYFLGVSDLVVGTPAHAAYRVRTNGDPRNLRTPCIFERPQSKGMPPMLSIGGGACGLPSYYYKNVLLPVTNS